MLPAGKVLDTSDWRGAPLGSTLYVLWTVDQTRARPPVKGGDLTKYEVPLELTLALNGHPHTVLLETDAASAYSGTCPGVAFFYAGIDIAFRLLRTEGGGAVLTRTVTSESSPTKSELLYAFEMPTDVRVSQELVTAGPDGTRSVTSCTAVALP
jgi:hypothetical protein